MPVTQLADRLRGQWFIARYCDKSQTWNAPDSDPNAMISGMADARASKSSCRSRVSQTSVKAGRYELTGAHRSGRISDEQKVPVC